MEEYRKKTASLLSNHQPPFGSAKEPKTSQNDLAFLPSFPPHPQPPKSKSIVEMLLDDGGKEDANDVSEGRRGEES